MENQTVKKTERKENGMMTARVRELVHVVRVVGYYFRASVGLPPLCRRRVSSVEVLRQLWWYFVTEF